MSSEVIRVDFEERRVESREFSPGKLVELQLEGLSIDKLISRVAGVIVAEAIAERDGIEAPGYLVDLRDLITPRLTNEQLARAFDRALVILDPSSEDQIGAQKVVRTARSLLAGSLKAVDPPIGGQDASHASNQALIDGVADLRWVDQYENWLLGQTLVEGYGRKQGYSDLMHHDQPARQETEKK